MTTDHKNTWIEQLYDYVEYYYWAPNDLSKVTPPDQKGLAEFQKVKERMRRLEVPLNAIFAITLRLLPSAVVNRLLSGFLETRGLDFGKNFQLLELGELAEDLNNFTQPDIVLESNTARVFIELKVDSTLSVEQAQKYVFLHAIWNQKFPAAKTLYLFFLSPKDLKRQWQSDERDAVFSRQAGAAAVLTYLKATPWPVKLGNMTSTTHLHADAAKILDSLEVGSATWDQVGAFMQSELDRLDANALNESGETLHKLIEDFVGELRNRGLHDRKT